jgi:hypothetical protein
VAGIEVRERAGRGDDATLIDPAISRLSDRTADVLKDLPTLAMISLMAHGVSLFGLLISLFP